ncbi:hypothetical protein AcV7_006173 [Taiwanofungus camphoratus]|nr:hypothetical protein AcV7_006173 [Antrodia cinnamomea]
MSSEHEPSFQELPPPPSFSDLYPRRASVAHTDSHYAESAPPTGSTPYLPPAAVPGLFHDASAPSTPRDSAYATPDALSDTARPPFDALGGAPLLARPLSRAPATPPTKEVATPPGSDAGLASGASRYLKTPWYRRPFVWLAAFAVLAIVVLAVVLPVYFVVVKPRRHHGSSSSLGTGGSGDGNGNGGGKGSGANPESPTGATTGGNGSVVVMDDGTNFTYINPFGGYWVYDPKNPFDTSARANSWTPPLNTSWDWGADRIFGVNLGGLFVLEPFISPALFQAHPDAADEWTLSADMAADGTLQSTMENHYSTFVTEQDIAQIAGAGLNWVRLPIPFWAIETWANVGVSATGSTVAEPFLARTCWSYILRVFEWARKYGIRINLDLHTIPGSQNGYNHSGKLGEINFLNGPMGVANAERALEYIRVIAEFISQPEYRDVIPMFGMVNEALLSTIGKDQLTTFYLRAYDVVRNITGIGAGNGPFLSIHDGFMGTNYWQGFLVGSDRIVLDTHPYFAFDGQPNNQPIDIPATGGNGTVYGGQWPQQACNAWGPEMNQSRNAFGVTIAGEFSNGWNDCGLWMRGVNISASYVGNCSVWEDYTQWDQATKDGIKEFALASMDALGDWFFWTWKIGNSSTSNMVESPLWSYQLGLEQGWMPTDPREAAGTCGALGVKPVPWNNSFAAWQTGGPGAGTIAASSLATYSVWPPTTLANVNAASLTLLPQYTPTASVVSLPPPSSYTAATASVDGGWADAQDVMSAPTPIAGCAYPDAWSAVGSPIPTAGCGAVAYAAQAEPTPQPTAPPARRAPGSA